MTRSDRSGLLLHDVRRAVQTPKTFANWLPLLTNMALERAGRGKDMLTFQARSGLRIDCPNVAGARVPIYEIFAEDTYRLNWFLGDPVDRPMQVLDIGGHIGTFACRLAQLYPAAVIQVFEPSPVTAGYLTRNVRQNGLSDRITVVEAAVTATKGFALLADNGGGSGLNSLIAAAGAGSAGSANPTEVPTVVFDDVVAETPGPIDLVKIDCEGGEYDLVRGSSQSSWAGVQRVVLEYHEVAGESWAGLKAWFAEVGLHVVAESPSNSESLGSAWLSRQPLPTRT
jgi:FkbM family methyltransferase